MKLQFNVGEKVALNKGGAVGVIVVLVRADDDPRKCVPRGGPALRLRGDVPERDEPSYLVLLDDRSALRWSHPHGVTPLLPRALATTPRRSDGLLSEVKALSYGALQYLTGSDSHDALSRLRARFIQHIIATASNGANYRTWMDAWRWFLNGAECDALHGWSDAEKLYMYAQPVPANQRTRDALGCEEFVHSGSTIFTLNEMGSVPENEARGNFVRVGFAARYWLDAPEAKDLLARAEKSMADRAAAVTA